MNILVTGGCGFIGSNFCHYWRKHHPDDNLIIVDKFGYAGRWENLEGLISEEDYYSDSGGEGLPYYKNGRVCLQKIDLSDPKFPQQWKHFGKKAFNGHGLDCIINFASESHVDNSISAPEVFIDSNVKGMFNVLEVTKGLKIPLFHISTDEVLKHDNPKKLSWNKWGFNRPKTDFPVYSPSSVYSATKASQEMLLKSYQTTYGITADIIRMTNNYGPRQHPEKLIPMAITKAMAGEKIPIYKNGEQMRDWTYVFDTCRALDLIIHKSKGNKIWHIASNQEQRNIDVIYSILKKVSPVIVPGNVLACSPRIIDLSYRDKIEFVQDRLGHDFSYSLDSGKVRGLGWSPQVSFEQGLEQTIKYYENR